MFGSLVREYEGTVCYGIRLKARARHEDEETELIINIEAPNNFNPGYSLVTRGQLLLQPDNFRKEEADKYARLAEPQ